MTAAPHGLPAGAGLLAFLALGALGSVHCLGMCGPLVTMYADRTGTDARGPSFHAIRQHALFNAGRTVSYAALGAAMGALGAALFDAAGVVAVGDGVRAVVGLVVGSLIVAAGVRYALGGAAGSHTVPGLSGLFGRVSGVLVPRIDRLADGPGIVALGALHGLLPCPLLYPVYLYAFARGSPVEGAAALAALGLGTFPTLFVYGLALGSLGAGTRARLHRALGVGFVLLGTAPIGMALGILGVSVPHVPLPHP
ncbi:MAG: sulfite exporter TauE/SafE family protein [Haloferacaceae archaeon]